MKQTFFTLILLILFSAICVTAQIPQTMSYQGVLTDTDGALVADGDYSMQFNLYNVSTAGSALWTETQTAAIANGIFNVRLGALNALTLPFDEAYWLGISIDGGDELLPRIELSSSAYSFNSISVMDSSIVGSSVANGQLLRSINSLTDDVQITGGDNIDVSQSANSLIITATGATGDITDIAAGMGLSGGGASGDVALHVLAGTGLSVGDSVILDLPYTDSRYVEEGQLNAITSPMIEEPFISSIAGVSDDAGNIDLVAGSNMTITANDANNTITFSSSGGTGGGDITAVNAGNGLSGGGTAGDVVLDHADMSTQNSVDNGNGVVIQDVTMGALGHLTGLTSYDLDNRYYSETESDGRFVNEGQVDAITGAMIVDGSVDSDDIANGSISSLDLADNAVTASNILPNVLSSVDGVSNDAGNIDLIAGSNITITPDDGGNQITFSATSSNLWTPSASDIYYSAGNVGIGTSVPSSPLTIAAGTSSRGLSLTHNQSAAASAFGIFVDLNRTGTGNADAYGINSLATNDNGVWSTRGLNAIANGASGGPKYGVYAVADGSGSLYGVKGVAGSDQPGSEYGVFGEAWGTGTASQYGVYGQAHGTGTGNHYGVYGTASGGGNLWAGYFDGNTYVDGNLGIGTATPSTALEVNGTIQSSSGGFMFPDATVQTTAATAAASNTLDEAYDEGGAGAGRIITADAGALQVNGNDGVLFGGTYSVGSIPLENAGTRMMWYPGKAAFRAGFAGFDQWNDANIGNYSMALGLSVTASGNNSTAFGMNTAAGGQFATAMGNNTIASGNSSTSMGSSTEASGIAATAIGSNTIASGSSSLATGASTTASGLYSTAMGRNVSTSGNGSMIIGDFSTATVLTRSIDNAFYSRFANGYFLYSNATTTVGAFLGANANSWSTISDSTKKENLKAVDGEEVLNKIKAFKLSSWNYKGQDAAQFRHYGPMAQDFYAAFGHDGIGKIGNDTTLSSSDFDGINFIAIQALEKRTAQLKAKIKEIERLQHAVISLKEENGALQQKLIQMEAGFKEFKAFMVNYKNQQKQTDSDVTLTNLK